MQHGELGRRFGSVGTRDSTEHGERSGGAGCAGCGGWRGRRRSRRSRRSRTAGASPCSVLSRLPTLPRRPPSSPCCSDLTVDVYVDDEARARRLQARSSRSCRTACGHLPRRSPSPHPMPTTHGHRHRAGRPSIGVGDDGHFRRGRRADGDPTNDIWQERPVKLVRVSASRRRARRRCTRDHEPDEPERADPRPFRPGGSRHPSRPQARPNRVMGRRRRRR